MINDFLTKLNQTFIDDPNWFNQFISNEKGEGGEGGEELVILDEDALKEYFELNIKINFKIYNKWRICNYRHRNPFKRIIRNLR